MTPNKILDIDNLQSLLKSNDYISDSSIITSTYIIVLENQF